jgi:hypothetical protein
LSFVRNYPCFWKILDCQFHVLSMAKRMAASFADTVFIQFHHGEHDLEVEFRNSGWRVWLSPIQTTSRALNNPFPAPWIDKKPFLGFCFSPHYPFSSCLPNAEAHREPGLLAIRCSRLFAVFDYSKGKTSVATRSSFGSQSEMSTAIFLFFESMVLMRV